MRRAPIVLDRATETANGCLEWQGPRNRTDYGRVSGTWYAHRLSYEQNVGPIPPGLLVLHRCDNPPCVNPAHLFVGTNVDNMRDCVTKDRIWRKVPIDKHDEIMARLKAGERQRDIALAFGVNRNQIRRIAKTYGWQYRGGDSCPRHDVPKRRTRSGRAYCHVCVTERSRRRRLEIGEAA